METSVFQITAKEWFDKTYGNTYYSVRVSTENGPVLAIEMGYGYGDQYMHEAIKKLNKLGYSFKMPFSDYPNLIFVKYENCLKRDVLAWGKL